MEEKEIRDNQPDEKINEEASVKTEKTKKKKISFKCKIIIAIVAVIVFLTVCVLSASCLASGCFLNDWITGNDDAQGKVYPPIDESLLSDTKPEGFDIMEYEKYIEYHDINIYYKKDGIKESVNDENAGNYGEAFSVVYNVMLAIRDGNSDLYNLYMGSSELKKSDFTQQQIYDITITFQPGYTDDEKVSYDKSVFKVEYKIHENNGTYRNNIESDASRPIYFIVDNSSGEMLVTDMIEP